MIRISCSGKLHSFHLAEQLERHYLLDKLYTIFHQQKNAGISRFVSRIDSEKISLTHISTYPVLAALVKWGSPYRANSLFDARVSKDLVRDKKYGALVAWSGMSIESIKQAKQDGKVTVVERGSSHIASQIPLLEEEYKRWGYHFERDNRVIDQELEEYETADFITIPSEFVRASFLEKGITPKKLFKNNFGSSAYFFPTQPKRTTFTILYLGTLSLRKGLPYFFEALKQLDIDRTQYQVWFVGSIQKEIQAMLPQYHQSNWKFFGHVSHHHLPDIISQCSVAVHPSLEEGLSMVIPQLMSCGVPVIATTNTGGADIITDGDNGFIIPIRSPEAIADRLVLMYHDKQRLTTMQSQAQSFGQHFGTWDNYGDRYASFLKEICVLKS